MITKAYANVSAFLATYKNDQRGVTAIEYGLIGVAMAAVVSVAFASNGTIVTGLTKAFDAIGTSISAVAPTK